MDLILLFFDNNATNMNGIVSSGFYTLNTLKS